MGFFDRFKSSKGKADAKAPRSTRSGSSDKSAVKPKAADAQKKAFANVPSGQSEAPKKDKDKEKTVAPTQPSDTGSAPMTKESTWEAYRLLLKPVVTEKSSAQTGQYTFEVPVAASKIEIRNAVLHTYGVQPVAVNTIHLKGKAVRYGQTYGRQKDRKKAIVTLPAGKTIDVFSA